jgi:acetyl-CoA C-acetyltransferase
MSASPDPVVILSAARTPLGRFMGELSPFSAHKLGAHVIGAALERAKLAPERIDEVLMGNVLPAGQGRPRRGRPHAAPDCRTRPAPQLSTRSAAPA